VKTPAEVGPKKIGMAQVTFQQAAGQVTGAKPLQATRDRATAAACSVSSVSEPGGRPWIPRPAFP